MKTLTKKYFILSISFFIAALAQADCGADGVQIIGASEFERESSCSSLNKVINLLSLDEKKITPTFKLYFEAQATIKIGHEFVPVHGYFDDETFEIHITSLSTPRSDEVTPFGLKWTQTQGVSYVLHEIGHLVLATHLKEKSLKFKREWHEFFAYAVQLELMDLDLRNQVLEAHSQVSGYNSPRDVEIMVYEMNPDIFAVKAYKSMKAWGGVSFLKKLALGQIKEAL